MLMYFSVCMPEYVFQRRCWIYLKTPQKNCIHSQSSLTFSVCDFFLHHIFLILFKFIEEHKKWTKLMNSLLFAFESCFAIVRFIANIAIRRKIQTFKMLDDWVIFRWEYYSKLSFLCLFHGKFKKWRSLNRFYINETNCLPFFEAYFVLN